MNHITLIGNLTKDPELRMTPSNVPVCSFTIAVNRRHGEKQTDFFRVQAWRGLGENCSKYLKKGKKVAVGGELQTRTYEQDGQTKLAIDVVAAEVEFLSPSEKSETSHTDSYGFTELTSADVPF